MKKAEGDEQLAADALLNDTQPLELSQDVMDFMYDAKEEEEEEEEKAKPNKHNTIAHSNITYHLNHLPGFPPKANVGAIGIRQLVQVKERECCFLKPIIPVRMAY